MGKDGAMLYPSGVCGKVNRGMAVATCLGCAALRQLTHIGKKAFGSFDG